MHRATRSELEAYARDGYVVREAVVPSGEVAKLRGAVEGVNRRVLDAADPTRSAVEWIEGKGYERILGSSVKWDWDGRSRGIRSMEPFCHLDPRLGALTEDPRLTRPVTDLLGTEGAALFTDKLNLKRPGGAPFPWHQDGPYWAFGCAHVDRLVSVALYLCETDPRGGCLWVFPGSHRQGRLPAPKEGGRLARLYADVSVLGDQEPVPIEVSAGSLLFFHADLVHGAEPNRTNEARPALYLTYQPPGFPPWQPPLTS